MLSEQSPLVREDNEQIL